MTVFKSNCQELDNYINGNNLQNLLFPHQISSIEWMFHMCKQGKGCLNADALGLGKTMCGCVLLQITLPRYALVIAPSSCVFAQWIRNLLKYSTYFKVYELKSNKVTQYFMNPDQTLVKGSTCLLQELHNDPYMYKVVVTNFNGVAPYPNVPSKKGMSGNKYELSRPLGIYEPEITPLNSTIWDMVIVDEVHNISNGVNTKLDENSNRQKQLRYYRLSRLRMNQYGGIRIGLTGTPIQNRISDIVSIFTFLGVQFSPRVSKEEVKDAITKYMFRRTEDDLNPILRTLIKFPELPFEEIVKDVIYETEEEADIYRIVIGKLTGNNVPGGTNNPYSNVQYENNPLIRTMRECYLSADINMFINIHNKAYNGNLPYWYGSQSKINMIANDIIDFASENRSFICFVHFYAEKEALCQKISEVGIRLGMGPTMGYYIFFINGEMDPQERDLMIIRSKECIDKGFRCICFATIQSCSDGLNMQSFDSVVITTSHWNPAKELQAIKRTHRIGQSKLVRVYRYIHRCIFDGENSVSHIDIKKIEKQEDKIQKFIDYIDNTPNAAHNWPVRDMPDPKDGKSVIFKKTEFYDSRIDPNNGLTFWDGNRNAIIKPEPLGYVSQAKQVALNVSSFYEAAGRGKGEPIKGMSYVTNSAITPLSTFQNNRNKHKIDIFDFDRYSNILTITKEHYRGIELFLRTGILIQYLYDYNIKETERKIFIEEIKQKGKLYIDKLTDVFEMEGILISWYERFAPEKVKDVDDILLRYIYCESELFNKLYRIYINQDWIFEKLWFYDPRSEDRPRIKNDNIN
jgi:hypothetical protein